MDAKVNGVLNTRGSGNHLTGSPAPNNKWALDVRNLGTVSVVDTAVSVESYTNNTITATAHKAIIGDIIKFATGDLTSREFTVLSVDTDTIVVGEDFDVAPTALDTFNIYRPTSQVISSTGSASTIVQFSLNASAQDVLKNTVTPANNKPLPVEILDTTGVVDMRQAVADIASIEEDTAALAGAIAGNEVQVDVVSSALPTGAATAAKQDTGNSSLATIAGAVAGTEMQVDVLSSALPTGASTAANQATEISHLATIAGAVSGTEVQVDLVGSIPAGTNNIGDVDVLTLPALPAGTNAIGTVKVTETIPPKLNAEPFARVTSSITTSAYTQLVAATALPIYRLEIYNSTGETLVLAAGAESSETDFMYVMPGGNGMVDMFIPDGTRVSVKAVSANTSGGELTINDFIDA